MKKHLLLLLVLIFSGFSSTVMAEKFYYVCDPGFACDCKRIISLDSKSRNLQIYRFPDAAYVCDLNQIFKPILQTTTSTQYKGVAKFGKNGYTWRFDFILPETLFQGGEPVTTSSGYLLGVGARLPHRPDQYPDEFLGTCLLKAFQTPEEERAFLEQVKSFGCDQS